MIAKKILYWYDNNKRSLPWRIKCSIKQKEYNTFVSEFMLQQTQVKTVIPYFKNFIKEIPSLKILSQTNENKILKLWEGLGYYRRARHLHLTSKMLIKNYNGVLPKDYNLIMKFPGIGNYTANALLALVYNKPTIALDVNVKRVFSRILNKDEKKINFDELINNNKKKLFKSKNRNKDFAEALIEFGALVCRPKEPRCVNCNIKKNCKYFKSKNKFKKKLNLKTIEKSYDIFCYLNQKNKKIALTKTNNLGFLNKSNLPMIKAQSKKANNKNWNFLCNYKSFISNKKLNINLYYKFSNKLPLQFNWYKFEKNNEFIPTFTKNIFKRLSKLF